MVELVARQVEHLELALAAERITSGAVPPAYGTLLIHVATLIAEIDPLLDAQVIGAYLSCAIAPPVLHRLGAGRLTDLPTLQHAAAALVHRLVPAG